MGTVGAITTGFLAKQMEPVVNEIFVKHNVEKIKFIIIGILFIFILKGISSYGESVIISYIGRRLIPDFQYKIYNSLIYADLKYVQTNSIGTLVAKSTSDIENMGVIITETTKKLGKDILTLLSLIFVMFYQDYVLASLVFFIFPIAIIPVNTIGKKLYKITKKARE